MAPGLVASESTRPLLSGDQETTAAAMRPLGRIGQPADIAEAVVFLLSNASSWTTGTVVTVDGGALLVTGVGSASLESDVTS